jgi:hypothetical protein
MRGTTLGGYGLASQPMRSGPGWQSPRLAGATVGNETRATFSSRTFKRDR